MYVHTRCYIHENEKEVHASMYSTGNAKDSAMLLLGSTFFEQLLDG